LWPAIGTLAPILDTLILLLEQGDVQLVVVLELLLVLHHLEVYLPYVIGFFYHILTLCK
jgi:hypothetical protein